MADFINVTTKMFFDRAKVIAAMDNKTARVLGSTGAFTWRAMKQGMRYRKSASKPGDYPSARRGNALLRDRVLFGYAISAGELVVGPSLLDRTDKEVAAVGKTVPQLINEGGAVVRRRVWDPKKKESRYTKRSFVWRYRARPFIALTMPAAAKKLADNMERLELRAG